MDESWVTSEAGGASSGVFITFLNASTNTFWMLIYRGFIWNWEWLSLPSSNTVQKNTSNSSCSTSKMALRYVDRIWRLTTCDICKYITSILKFSRAKFHLLLSSYKHILGNFTDSLIANQTRNKFIFNLSAQLDLFSSTILSFGPHLIRWHHEQNGKTRVLYSQSC